MAFWDALWLVEEGSPRGGGLNIPDFLFASSCFLCRAYD